MRVLSTSQVLECSGLTELFTADGESIVETTMLSDVPERVYLKRSIHGVFQIGEYQILVR